jgi:hypothetical protein
MPDVPFIAFWMVSLRHFFELTSGSQKFKDWLICAGGLLGACFLSLLGFGLVMLFLAYPVLVKRFSGRGLKISSSGLILLVTLPFILWTIWYLRAYIHYDRFVLINTLTHMESRSFLTINLLTTKALSFILNAGAVCIFPLAVWFSLATRKNLPVFSGVFVLSSFFLVWYQEWESVHALLFGTFFSTGLLILYSITSLGLRLIKTYLRPIKNPDKNEDSSVIFITQTKTADLSLLLLWVIGIASACLIVFYSGSTRYFFLAVPPIILLIVYFLETSEATRNRKVILLRISIVLTLFYSLAVSYGDYLFAETYRRSAKEICEEFDGEDTTVFYTGEWGFRYYMDKFGAHPITKTGMDAKVNDLIIKPYTALPWVTLYDGDRYSTLLERRVIRLPYPVRILDFESHAGFYSTGWGILPFSLATESRWEWFNVYRVTREFDGEVPEVVVPY